MQRAIIELQTPHHARAKILDQDIGGCDQPADDVDRVGRFQVEHEALLADIELAEGGAAAVAQRRPGPHRLAFGGLDLDDLRAHVGQHPRAMRAGDRGRKIEDAKAMRSSSSNCPHRCLLSSFAKLPRPPLLRRLARHDPRLRGSRLGSDSRSETPSAVRPTHLCPGGNWTHSCMSGIKAGNEGVYLRVLVCHDGDGRLRPRGRARRRFGRPSPGAASLERRQDHASRLSGRHRTIHAY